MLFSNKYGVRHRSLLSKGLGLVQGDLTLAKGSQRNCLLYRPTRSRLWFNELRDIYFDTDEDTVIPDVSSVLKQLQRHELWITKPGIVRILNRFLELLPRRIRSEAFDNALSFVWIGALIEQFEYDRQTERPFQDVVVLPRQNADVDGKMRSFTRSISTRKERDAQTISVSGGVEGSALQFKVFRGFRFSQFRLKIRDLPDECSVCDACRLVELM